MTTTNLIANTVSSINNYASQAYFDDVAIDQSLTVTGAATLQSISTVNMKATNAIMTNTLQANNSITTPNMFVNNISSVNTINGIPYPPQFIGTPTGGIVIWAGGTQSGVPPPNGYLYCDGSVYLQSLYPALFAVIGQTYINQYRGGAFNSDIQFIVPDLTFAIPMGAPLAQYSCSVSFSTYNVAGGPVVTIPNVVVQINQIWSITNCTGTINVGTFFPDIGDQNQGMYIQQFLKYGGTGASLVLMGNATGSATFPLFAAGTINSEGVLARAPVYRDELYKVGTFGFQEERNVARKQQPTEVAEHTHTFTSGGGTSYNVSGANLAIGSNGVPTSEPNTLPSIAGTPTAQPYPTAPNYINMFYVIKYV
jgi:hypothetical protein